VIYLAWYLGIGAFVFAAIFIPSLFSNRGRTESELRLPFADEAKDWLMDKVVGPFLGSALIVVGWPIALFLRLRNIFSKKVVEKDFAVARDDLQEALAIEDIERRERVDDPMHAVPDLPFGHLHVVWKHFLEQLAPDATIWTFSSRWTTRWERKELRAGYVAVRGDTIGPYFLTLRKELKDE
jgi:hypothetical protein